MTDNLHNRIKSLNAV